MYRKAGSAAHRKQAGFLIPLALFVIVALSALAVAMLKISSQSDSSSFREGIAMQSFYAAESATAYAMNRLFMPNPSRTTATASCAALVGDTINFSGDGLGQCSATLNCSSVNDSSNTITFYTVTSSAECGAGELRAKRIINASAYLR